MEGEELDTILNKIKIPNPKGKNTKALHPNLIKVLVVYDIYLKRKKRMKEASKYNHLCNIAKFLRENEIKKPSDITPEIILNYVELRRRTFNLIYSLKYFCEITSLIDVFEAFHEEWKIKHGNFKQLPRIKKNKCFTKAQIKRLFKELKEGNYDYPFYLIFKIQYETVSRISEVIDIRYGDIEYDTENNRYKLTINIRKTDVGSKEPIYETKTAYLTKETSEELREFFIKSVPGGHTDLVFNVNRMTCDKVIKDISKRWYTNPMRWFSTHWFRHTAITRIIEKTGNIAYAKEMAGHKRIDSTMIYYKQSGHMSLKVLKEVFE